MNSPIDEQLQPRVCAVVVTFNRKDLLRQCLHALQAQTRALDQILVVNNASTDDTSAMMHDEFPNLELLDLPENGGGAGGFHTGMKHAFEAGFDWLWLMDDDGRPAPNCLQLLLESANVPGVRVPLQQDSSGRLYGISVWRRGEVDVSAQIVAHNQTIEGKFLFRFVGPLIAREVVAKIGLPNREFFIWFDDIEYALRLQNRREFAVFVVPEALFAHDFGDKPRPVRLLWRHSTRSYYPPWKLYYGARNPCYTLVHERKRAGELRYFLGFQMRHLLGDLLYEPDRLERAQMRLSGLLDGARGKLGKRS